MINMIAVEALASKLCLLCYDCYNADLFLDRSDREEHADIQLAVDTIYRFYMCDLIFSPAQKSIDRKMSSQDLLKYLRELLIVGSYVNNPEIYIMWVKFDLCATQFAQEIVKRFNLKNVANSRMEEFGEFVEKLFIERGVPWSGSSLVA